MADGKMNWYTLHVYSSMEKSVKNALEERIAQSGELRSSFGEVLLPTEKVHEVRNGRKVTSERRMYPGYVFIQMEMNDATWHLVNSTPRIIEFLGNNNPVPLSPTEVANILSAAENSLISRVRKLNSRSVRWYESSPARLRTLRGALMALTMTRAV